MTVTVLQSDQFTYAVTDLDGTTRTITGSTRQVLDAVIPGYAALCEALDAAKGTGSRSQIRNAREALLDARRAHAHSVRVHAQRSLNAATKADGTWAALTAAERRELTGAATGAIPTGLYITEDTYVAGVRYRLDVARWDANVCLVVNTGDYGLLGNGDDWIEEPIGHTLVLDPAHEEGYLRKLENAGIATCIGVAA